MEMTCANVDSRRECSLNSLAWQYFGHKVLTDCPKCSCLVLQVGHNAASVQVCLCRTLMLTYETSGPASDRNLQHHACRRILVFQALEQGISPSSLLSSGRSPRCSGGFPFYEKGHHFPGLRRILRMMAYRTLCNPQTDGGCNTVGEGTSTSYLDSCSRLFETLLLWMLIWIVARRQYPSEFATLEWPSSEEPLIVR